MRRLVLLLLLLFPSVLLAQGPRPEWCNASSRRLSHPDKNYIVGYATGERQQGESTGDALARMENAARADAAKHIEVTVESTTIDQMRSLQQEGRNGLDESIQRYFTQENYSSTTIQIANLQVLSWYNPDGSEVAALAYVKKRDFARYHDRQIESLLSKMESALETIGEQERQGQKIKAVTTAEEALRMCPDVEYSQRMIALSDATTDDLQMPRYSAVVRNLAACISRLRHATAFYISCQATLGENPYSLFNKEVRGLLSDKGCQFSDSHEGADWVIEIDASVINTTHREGMPWFAYIDGTLSITNGATGQKVFEDRLSTLEPDHYDGIKGGDFNVDKAARQAYHKAAGIVADAILRLVQE